MFGLKRLRADLIERISNVYTKLREDDWELRNDIDLLARTLKLERRFTASRVEYVPMEEKKNAN